MRGLRIGLLLVLGAAPMLPQAVAQYPSTGYDGVGPAPASSGFFPWPAPPRRFEAPRPSPNEYAAPWYPAPAESVPPPWSPYASSRWSPPYPPDSEYGERCHPARLAPREPYYPWRPTAPEPWSDPYENLRLPPTSERLPGAPAAPSDRRVAWTPPPRRMPAAEELAAPVDLTEAAPPPAHTVSPPPVPPPPPAAEAAPALPQASPRDGFTASRPASGLPLPEIRRDWANPAGPSPSAPPGWPGGAPYHSVTYQPADPPPSPPGDQTTGQPAAGQDPRRIGPEPGPNLNEQFLTQSSLLLKQGDWQYDVGVQYAFQETTRPVVVPPGMVVERRLRHRDLFMPLALRYGLSDTVEVFGALPVGVSLMEVSDSSTGATGEGLGFGDTTVGLIFALSERGKWPVTTGRLELIAPTGDPSILPTAEDPGMGNGMWGLGVGLQCVQVFEPVVVFGSAGYRHLFASQVMGQEIQTGEVLSYGLGAAVAINEDTSFSAELFGQSLGPAKINGAHVLSSSQEPYSIRLSMIRRLARTRRLQPFVAFGLNNDATDVSCGVIYTADQKGNGGWTWPKF